VKAPRKAGKGFYTNKEAVPKTEVFERFHSLAISSPPWAGAKKFRGFYMALYYDLPVFKDVYALTPQIAAAYKNAEIHESGAIYGKTRNYTRRKR
jgi:hypothetical protein